MSTRATLVIVALLAAATLGVTVAMYPSLPNPLPTHWNIHGQVDGWGDKRWAALIGPGTIALCLVMLFLLPWLSPRNFKVEPFRGTFNYIIVILAAMFAYVQGAVLYAGLHPQADVSRMLIGGIFLFLALLGNVLGKVRRNFWMGIRTPWTLASDAVWIATHRLAARLLLAGGLIGLLAILVGAGPEVAFGVLMAALVTPVAYSLVLYKRLEREGRL